VKTHCGPIVINLAGQTRAINFDPTTREFSECNLHQAVRHDVTARQGDYLILENPVTSETADGNQHPTPSAEKPTPELDYGKKIIIPGPVKIALWPGQVATKVKGHDLRSDQYLIIRVYDEDLAKANWSATVAKKAEPLWQGTKVVEKYPNGEPKIRANVLEGDWRKGKGRRPIGAYAGPGQPLITNPGDARRAIYLPAYARLVNHWLDTDPEVAGWLLEARKHPGNVYLRDHDTGRGIDRNGPMSHSWLLATWLNSSIPTHK
jgi:hypothetical protein